MRLLITGAYGFVGTNLCRYLTARGHACEAVDIAAARRDDLPYGAFYTWDELGKIAFSGYDAVIHLAGKAHDLKRVASEQEYFDINMGLTQKIFTALCEGSAGRQVTYVHFSSSKANAQGNAYGRSKLAAEDWLREAAGTAPAIRMAILRPAMIHGPGNKGNINLLWGVARRGVPWPLAAFENRRSFTSIGNVCAAVEALCGATLSPGAQVFPIADDDMLSTNRLIELIAETCGRKARLWRLPRNLMRLAARIGDVLHLPLNTERLGKLTEDSRVDNAALKQALGWSKMPIGAEEGMRQTLASFLGQTTQLSNQ